MTRALSPLSTRSTSTMPPTAPKNSSMLAPRSHTAQIALPLHVMVFRRAPTAYRTRPEQSHLLLAQRFTEELGNLALRWDGAWGGCEHGCLTCGLGAGYTSRWRAARIGRRPPAPIAYRPKTPPFQ